MLEARGITKRYPGVTALENVDFSIASGEVLGFIGENGAGKSTLIKVLGGLTSPDSGEIFVNGEAVSIESAAKATQLGIAIIHQELNDLDNLDVAGNVLLGREPRRFGLLNRAAIRTQAQEALDRLGIAHLSDVSQGKLSIGQRQLVEIAKALSHRARIIIMDEPTSSLAAAETERLLAVVRDLAAQGVGIVYVSHRLNEVKAIADRVIGLRDGKNAGGLQKSEITTEAMVRLMVGRDVSRPPVRNYKTGKSRLNVCNLVTQKYPSHSVSFSVGQGEIVGLAGLVGAGRTEVVRAICGVDERIGGSVVIDDVAVSGIAQAIKAGLFLAPEDRRKEGLLVTMSVRENITLPNLAAYAPGGLIRRNREVDTAETMKQQLGVKAPTIESEVRGLSGGNQQKVVLAKWLAMGPKVLIVDEPTRGIDIGARAEIYARMRALADEGVSILMVSSDMEEVLALSDRILVMAEGELRGELSSAEASEERVMALAVPRADAVEVASQTSETS